MQPGSVVRIVVLLGGATLAGRPLSALPVQDTEAPDVGHVSLLLGARALDEDDWSPVEDQVAFGLELDWRGGGAPVGFEVGLSASSEEEDVRVAGLTVDVEAELVEVYGGARWTFGEQDLRPYVGGGLSFVAADVEVSGAGATADDDDDSLGLYLHGGFQLDVGEYVIVGLDARVLLGTEIDLAGASGDADYFQVGALVGFTF